MGGNRDICHSVNNKNKEKTHKNNFKIKNKVTFLGRKKLYKMSWDWESFLLPVFVNKFLWKYSHVYFFTYCLRLFWHYNGGVEKVQQLPFGSKRLKWLPSISLQQKSADHCTEHAFILILWPSSQTELSYWCKAPASQCTTVT